MAESEARIRKREERKARKEIQVSGGDIGRAKGQNDELKIPLTFPLLEGATILQYENVV